ncbi:MAG: sugar ABC transporter permease [Treponema sp.]|nr:sugar ABC transporter permease [Treponema sp.]
MKAYKVKKIVSTVLIYANLVVVATVVIYPILWVVGSALNEAPGISRTGVLPERISLANFEKLFTEFNYGRWYLNTLYVAILTMIFSVTIHTMTAFVFARFPFKGRKVGLLTVMVLQMFPSFMSLIALYMIALSLGMLNNLHMLVIIYVSGGIPANIWLVRGYMLGIPRSMDEAASIDGATKMQLFRKIILPLSLPIMFFIALTSFMAPWMDYMLPRFLINRDERRTLAIGLFDLITGPNADFPAFCAGAVLVAVPITILYMVFQRFLLQGLMAGANKGE